MKWIFLYIFLLCVPVIAVGQSNPQSTVDRTTMVLKGRVINENGTPITGANIEGRNGRYTTTDIRGYFTIPANLGEEVVIRGLDFETVYYRINSLDDLEIRVQAVDESPFSNLSYATAIDSARYYFKRNREKSADFLIAGLSNDPASLTPQQQAAAYELLGDLYTSQEQHDLALDAYIEALSYERSTYRRIKKADALRLNGNYQEAIMAYTDLKKEKEKNTSQDLAVLKGLAKTYTATKQNQQAILIYENVLKKEAVIQDPVIKTAIISDLAALYNKTGDKDEAEKLYENAINVSANENTRLNITTQATAASFYNSNQKYPEEIALRKKNIEQINALKKRSDNTSKRLTDTISYTSSSSTEKTTVDPVDFSMDEAVIMEDEAIDFTTQGEQLKIGEALIKLNKEDEALEYLKSSLNEAVKRNDLEVQKEASRELYSIYRRRGESRAALEFNDIYLATVDQLYLAKEIELEENTRKTKELLSRQNRINNLEKDRKLTENKIQLISAQNELTAQTNERQRWIIYSLIALSLLLIALAYAMYRNNRQQKINNHLLALKSLRSQMNPHFIFNALNSVNSYIALNDERAANKYLADFSKLMRSVLENSELDFIPLQKEIELLSLYMKLEHERFKDQFDYKLIIDPEVQDLKIEVPPMLLQPIIENAVWHGLRYKKTKGLLLAHVTKSPDKADTIIVTITDDGIGRDQSQALKTTHQKKRVSKGLGNVDNRVKLLNELHDYHIKLQVKDAELTPDIGTQVIVIMGKGS